MSVFETVAEPRRRQILDLLRDNERAVGDLADALGISQPAVSKHLRVLRQSGLVTARVEAQRRVYQLRSDGLLALDEWLAPYRHMWQESLDRLERHLDASSSSTPHETETGRSQ